MPRMGLGIGLGLGGPQVWTPAALSPSMWFEPSPKYTFTDAGATINCAALDPIYTWKDRTSRRVAVQASTTSMPVLMTSGAGWRANFTSSQYTDITAFDRTLTSSGRTLAVKFSTAASGWIFQLQQSNPLIYLVVGDLGISAVKCGAFIRNDAGTSISIQSATTVTDSLPHTMLVRITPGGTSTLRIDGAQEATATAPDLPYTMPSPSSFSFSTAGGTRFAGNIFGAVMVDRYITDAECSKLETYFASLGV